MTLRRWTLFLLPLMFAACSHDAPPSPVAVVAPPPTRMAPADTAFATTAAQSDLFAIEISKIATEKAGREGIRDFAQTVVTTHTNSTGRLAAITQPHGLTLSPTLAPSQVKTVKTLSATPDGSRFRSRYFSSLIQSQIASLKQMRAYAKGGSDPELKQFATDQVELLQDQITTARKLPRQRN